VRKTRAAFEATAMQDGATGAARHALHKTVLMCTMTFFGLIGSFRHLAFTLLDSSRSGKLARSINYD